MNYYRIIFTENQINWMREHFANTSNAVCADYLGCSMRTMNRLASSLKLSKSKAYMIVCQANAARRSKIANTESGFYDRMKGHPVKGGEKYRFQKGHMPIKEMFGIGVAVARSFAMSDARRKLVAEERERIAKGLPQKTRLRLIGKGREAALLKYAMKKRGYEFGGRGSWEYTITPTTRRWERFETMAGSFNFKLL
jgi:hypothetical protein